jgi:hypothetical protein
MREIFQVLSSFPPFLLTKKIGFEASPLRAKGFENEA